MPTKPTDAQIQKLRSRAWFDNPANVDMTALYLERTMNYGLTLDELQSGRPIIGIAQTGSDITPCNRHHLFLATRVRDGIREAGGIAFEFPIHPIQETGKRPTATLDRNLQYLSLVEILYGYPIDGVVLTTGCDKTTPAQIMAAATVDIPAIVLSGGPMLNGWFNGVRTGSGTIMWKARELIARGEIDARQFTELVASSAPSAGHCNTMGTASTMNSLAEALGMSLPGCAAIPAPHRDRQEMAYLTGKRSVDMVWEDLKPSQVLTRAAFENAIVVYSAIGGSTNAPIQLNAIARHVGVELDNDDWERIGYDVPLLVNMQPAGEYLGEEYYRAGGVPAVVAELIAMGKINRTAITVNGRSLYENNEGRFTNDRDVIKAHDAPMKAQAGFLNLKGNLFDSAIMKTSVISDEFRERYLENPLGSGRIRGPRDGLRRAGGLPRAHRRSGARARRRHRARDSRRRADRLSGRGRGGQHALAGLPPEARRPRAALHRRRAPVGHVGQPVDPQRLPGGRDGRRARAAADRRPGPNRPRQANGRTCSSPTKSSRRDAKRSRRRAATRIRRARLRGRRSSAASSTSCRTGWC